MQESGASDEAAVKAKPLSGAVNASKDDINEERPRRNTITPNNASTNNGAANNKNPTQIIRSAWDRGTAFMRSAIGRQVTRAATTAATYPMICIGTVLMVSLIAAVVGIQTNFELDLDVLTMFTPTTSRTMEHRHWIFYEARFRYITAISNYPLDMIVHKGGGNVLEIQGINHLFEVLEIATELEGYQDICDNDSDFDDFDGYDEFIQFNQSSIAGMENETSSVSSVIKDCDIQGLTRFWNQSQEMFEQQVTADSDILPYLSESHFPDNTTVDLRQLVGVYNEEAGTASALFLRLNFPVARIGKKRYLNSYEDDLLDTFESLRQQWANEPGNQYRIEFTANFNLAKEFEDAIFSDFPLLIFTTGFMILFTMSVFWKHHRVESRSLLAVGAVLTIALSLATGFGIMFIIGIPYGIANNILPFIIIGVGLDDTYIIHGAFTRTDPQKPIMERIRDTFQEVGISIFMTTATTGLAFALGCISSVPAIKNLCTYAAPTLIIDFFYQITFFVSLMVLDERRVQANRYDCCICFVSQEPEPINPTLTGEEDEPAATPSPEDVESEQSEQIGKHDSTVYRIGEKFMSWYADQLLRPWVKALVVLLFAGFSALGVYYALQLKQEFSFFDLLPDSSPSKNFFLARLRYSEITSNLGRSYFRDLDQYDPTIQDQMIDYMDQVVSIDHVEESPFCWFRDVRLLQQDSNAFLEQKMKEPDAAAMLEELPEIISFLQNQTSILQQMSTKQIVNLLVDHPRLGLLYGPDIIMNDDGDVIHSRCGLNIVGLDHRDIPSQLELNRAYKTITQQHSLNQGPTSFYHAFVYEEVFHMLDFFEVAIVELRDTTLASIAVVSVFGFIFVPHWTAVLYLFPMMCLLYSSLMALLHVNGLTINVLTYVILVVSVGLLVDFVMHMLLRFFEVKGKTKEEKIKNTLKSTGTAILLGGISTFLGTVPLFFSNSFAFRNVCISIFSTILLGVTHGLILLPVLLSIFGSNGPNPTSTNDSSDDEERTDSVPKTDTTLSGQTQAVGDSS